MTAKVYINSDIDIPITLTGDITVSDIVDMQVSFTKIDNEAVTADLLYSLGDISIVADTIIASIPDASITVAGTYRVNVRITDTTGAIRNLHPTPEKITFYQD